MPVASQARVVWTFTVTVTLEGLGAIDGGTKTMSPNKRETHSANSVSFEVLLD
jgi:cytochrome c1